MCAGLRMGIPGNSQVRLRASVSSQGLTQTLHPAVGALQQTVRTRGEEHHLHKASICRCDRQYGGEVSLSEYPCASFGS